MDKNFAVKKIWKIICLLMIVGILCVIPEVGVQASTIDPAQTGQTEQRTNREEPGSADSRDDLSDYQQLSPSARTSAGLQETELCGRRLGKPLGRAEKFYVFVPQSGLVDNHPEHSAL